jgi:DNA-binding ferritin-like protein
MARQKSISARSISARSTRSISTKSNSKTVKTKTKKTKNIYKQIVACFMNMLNTVKLYHWKTTSYATHKATDQLYSDLNTKIDEFVEVMLGKPDVGKDRNYILDVQKINLQKYNNNTDFKKEVEYYKQFVIALSEKKEFNNNMKNVDLLAIRDEILALFNQFLYLLTLEK